MSFKQGARVRTKSYGAMRVVEVAAIQQRADPVARELAAAHRKKSWAKRWLRENRFRL